MPSKARLKKNLGKLKIRALKVITELRNCLLLHPNLGVLGMEPEILLGILQHFVALLLY